MSEATQVWRSSLRRMRRVVEVVSLWTVSSAVRSGESLRSGAPNVHPPTRSRCRLTVSVAIVALRCVAFLCQAKGHPSNRTISVAPPYLYPCTFAAPRMKRVFIGELDTFLSRRLVDRFAKALDWEIRGTLRPPVAVVEGTLPPPPLVTAVVPGYAANVDEFKRVILDSDVIIFPLTDSITDASAAIRMLSHISYDVEKTFVLVSSCVTWSQTFAKQKAIAAALKAEERRAAIEAGEEPPEDETNEEPLEAPTFTEEMYKDRTPHSRYQHWRDLEQAVKAANSDTLHTHVVFAGIPYGRDLDAPLTRLFQAAWHREPLPLYGDGANTVPLIHVDDLTTMVFKVANALEPLPQRYLFGVDRGNCTLAALLSALNVSMGVAGSILPDVRVQLNDRAELLLMDLKVESATIGEFIDEAEWVSQEGIVANMDKICNEFRAAKGLSPLRIALLGPPHCGKTTLAARLSEEYCVPHVNVPTVVAAFLSHKELLRAKIAAHREKRRAEKRAAEREIRKQAAREALEAAEEARKAAAAADEAGAGEGTGEASPGDGAAAAAAERVPAGGPADDFEVEFDVAAPPPRDNATGEGGAGDGETGASPDAAAVPGGSDAEAANAEATADDTAASDPAVADDDDDEPLNALKAELAAVEKALNLGTKVKATAPATAAIATRYCDSSVAFMTKWYITQRVCRNSGYVLEGFPKSVRQALWLFRPGPVPLPDMDEEGKILEPTEEELLGDTAAAIAAVDEDVFPDHVIFADAPEECLISRCVEGDPHRCLARFQQRYAQYRAANPTAKLKPTLSLQTWLLSVAASKEGATAPPRTAAAIRVDLSGDDRDTNEPTMATLRRCLGPAHMVHPTAEELISAARNAVEEREAARLKDIAQQEALAAAADARARELAELRRRDERRFTSVLAERALATSMAQLQTDRYLMEYAVPAVTAAMKHVAAVRPDDPVDALADFLLEYRPKTQL